LAHYTKYTVHLFKSIQKVDFACAVSYIRINEDSKKGQGEVPHPQPNKKEHLLYIDPPLWGFGKILSSAMKFFSRRKVGHRKK
jgi:hypothetical protein